MPSTLELRWLAAGLDPALLMEELGFQPDPWQRRALRSAEERLLLLCCRQSGKSTATAVKALHAALFSAGSLVLLLSPSLRQSGELFKKLVQFYHDLGDPVACERETATTLAIANGSRVVCLPGTPDTIRGFSGVKLLIVDEAAMVADDGLFAAILPMLAVSRGQLVMLTTPFGRRGFFHEQWTGPEPWERIVAKASECPRIDPAFLDEQRRILGPRWYVQEYECEFVEAIDQVFSTDIVLDAFTSREAALFHG